MTANPDRSRWLLLIHQLPKEPAYVRVKVGRRLQRVGAIALKNSVYVLPRSDGTAEDFQWIRREILQSGGEATVVEAALVEGLSDSDLEAKFQSAKSTEYAALSSELQELRTASKTRRKRARSDEERVTLSAELRRFEQRLADVGATDFFGAPGRDALTSLLQQLRLELEPSQTVVAEILAKPRACTWVTRTGIHVDRIASAWLIRQFIDPEARFKWVAPRGYEPLAAERRFDMFEAEYSHEGDNCTFETLLQRFSLTDPGLRAIADIIHDIDLKESKFARPETAGVAACINGICRAERDDDERLARGKVVLDALLSLFSPRQPDATAAPTAAKSPSDTLRATRRTKAPKQ